MSVDQIHKAINATHTSEEGTSYYLVPMSLRVAGNNALGYLVERVLQTDRRVKRTCDALTELIEVVQAHELEPNPEALTKALARTRVRLLHERGGDDEPVSDDREAESDAA